MTDEITKRQQTVVISFHYAQKSSAVLVADYRIGSCCAKRRIRRIGYNQVIKNDNRNLNKHSRSKYTTLPSSGENNSKGAMPVLSLQF